MTRKTFSHAAAVVMLCMSDYDWKKTNNWAQLCNGALIVSALALWETDKNYMRTVLNKAVECNKPAVAAMDSGRFLPEAIYFASKIKASDIKAPSKKVWSGRGDQPMVLVHTDWTLGATDKFHNTLTINGALHTTGMATLEEVYDSADKKGGRFDLSKLFSSTSKVTRSVFIEKDKDLVVVDEITSTGAVSTVRFAFITATVPSLTPDGWLLTASNGRKMLLTASTSTGAAIKYDSLPTGKIEVHDQDISAWNNIGFTVSNPGTTVITTRLTPVE